jgi:cardiolipin synthase
MTAITHPTLLPAAGYGIDLIKSIEKATQRIAIATTIFHNDSARMEALIVALCSAAERGVTVSICADSYTYLEPNGPWRRILKEHSAQAYRALATERRLKASGVKFRWLGKGANFGVMGRTHTKWSTVDDTVYSFGGVNLCEMGLSNTDYMFKIRDAVLADTMAAQHEQLIKADRANHAGKNRVIPFTPKSKIMFDGGIPLHSHIYARAVQLAKQAESIVFVSQYCPTGKLARALRAKDARLYFNHWESANALNTLVIRAGMRSSKLETLYEREPYLHAKFIIFTMPGGHKVALTGSHNFQTGGVVLGTRELCLETSDKQIISRLESFFKKYVR